MKADLLKLRIAGIFGFLAVGLGAMGAHGLKSSWQSQYDAAQVEKLLDLWKTASLYHIVHAVVLVALAILFSPKHQGRWTFGSFALGTLIFSGTLYGYALTGVKALAMFTPVGGVILMLGWFLLMMASAKGLSEPK